MLENKVGIKNRRQLQKESVDNGRTVWVGSEVREAEVNRSVIERCTGNNSHPYSIYNHIIMCMYVLYSITQSTRSVLDCPHRTDTLREELVWKRSSVSDVTGRISSRSPLGSRTCICLCLARLLSASIHCVRSTRPDLDQNSISHDRSSERDDFKLVRTILTQRGLRLRYRCYPHNHTLPLS